MIKKVLLPIALAIIALIAVRVLDSETPLGGTIMVMAIGAGLGLYLNTIIFKEK